MNIYLIRVLYDWHTRRNILLLTLLALAIYGFSIANHFWSLANNGFVDANGGAIGNDFAAFWAAARLAIEGNAIGVFDLDTLFAAEHAVVPGATRSFPWNYPPTFHLAVLPLGYLPYIPSVIIFTLGGIAAYIWVIRSLWPDPLVIFTGLAFGSVILSVVHGQNSLYVMALLTGAMAALISGRQILAGFLIGLLVIKPHFGLLVPIALIAAGQWRAFVSAAVTTITLCAVATAVFGLEYWRAFFANFAYVSDILTAGELPLRKIVSISSALLYAGYSSTVAFWFQGAIALISALAVWVVWRRNGPTRAAGAVLIIAACLPSPYIYDYDLAILAGAGLLIILSGMENGVWLPFERELLAVWMVLPRIVYKIADNAGAQLTPVFLLILLAYAVWRALTLEPARRALPEAGLVSPAE